VARYSAVEIQKVNKVFRFHGHRSVVYCVQRVVVSSAMSVVPNIVAVSGLSPATTERRLFLLAQKVGLVQVIYLCTTAYGLEKY